MKPARLQNVLLYGVDPIDVVPLPPVEEDVASARPAAGVQPPGPGGDQLLETVHQIRIALEPWMGEVAVHGLNEAVAHLGVTLSVILVEGLGKIGVLAHC